VLFVLLLFVPMILEIAFASELYQIAHTIFHYWSNATEATFLSDVLFLEAGVMILLGALIAGSALYSSWAAMDARQMQFTESIWNWQRLKQERNSAVGVVFGLTMLIVGILYIVAAIGIYLPTV
jgi:hypothetical protein